MLSPHLISKLSVIDSLWKISCWLQLFKRQELEIELEFFPCVGEHAHNKEGSVNNPKLRECAVQKCGLTLIFGHRLLK